MVMANIERVGRALELLRDGLAPDCEATWKGYFGERWLQAVNAKLHNPQREPSTDDVAFLLNAVKATWNDLFGHIHAPAVRSLVFEAANARNEWAHQRALSSDDTLRHLDSMERLLEAFGDTAHREKIRTHRRELMRQIHDEESRSAGRRRAAQSTEGTPKAGLTPWRDVIMPHHDVATGRFEQAEFAANLAEVAAGTAEPEYQDPESFFARTYLTQGLSDLLTGAARRLAGQGGDPVIELQTNFGGGKTHSLIALYHLAAGGHTHRLPGVSDLLAEEGINLPAKVNRAVLVGQTIRPAESDKAEGGIRQRTLWGRMAYQLGGRAGYEMLRADDLAGTNPGSALKALFERFGPAVVLIDEWVAYARQFYSTGSDRRLPGGDFDTQFTFAQALTETAASVPNVVVLVAMPESHVEVGGDHGHTALERLKNVVTRVASQWQPASPDESFEIVRRRLFDPIPVDKIRHRDSVIRAFMDLYGARNGDFPSGVGEAEYRRRMELCYPIHPELFDRLFGEWSALDKFQRTRGVLRLMALAVSQLWQRQDRSLLIMPGNLPMDYALLVSEMKKYLEDGWDPVIKSDVDGDESRPLKLDKANSHFGRLSATRRAARSVYLASAPHPEGNRGVDQKSVVIACAQPGEPPGQFADALKRLSREATHMYVDGNLYWYSLIPNVNRQAADRAASNFDDRDADDEVRRRIGAQRDRGSFAAVQVFAAGPGDVPDDADGVRLVVLDPSATHSSGDANSPAVVLADRILGQRDGGPRLNRNMLVFVAATANRLNDLRAAARRFLAWDSIVNDHEAMNLTQHQLAQARKQRSDASEQVDSQIRETFNLALTPSSRPGTSEVDWQTIRTAGAGDLARRVSDKLDSEETLIDAYSGVRIRMDLDGRGERPTLWSVRGDIRVRDLWENYARLLYMPRLASREVLHTAIANRAMTLDWLSQSFAYAEDHDGQRWVGLNTETAVMPSPGGLLVHPEWLPEPAGEPPPEPEDPGDDPPGDGGGGGPGDDGASRGMPPEPPLFGGDTLPRAFYARFALDSVRCVKQLADIAENVASQLGTDVEMLLEVRASGDGFDDATRRTVSENARALNAESAEFE